MNRQPESQDIPASVALVVFAALAGAWLYFKAPAAASVAFKELDRYAEANLTAISIVAFSTLINIIWAYSILARSFGVNRQGQRLEILAKEGLQKKKIPARLPWVSALVSLGSTPFFYLGMRFLAFTHFPNFVSRRFFAPLWSILALDLGFSLFVLLAAMERGGWLGNLLGNRSLRLPDLPALQNSIVLGAAEEFAVHD